MRSNQGRYLAKEIRMKKGDSTVFKRFLVLLGMLCIVLSGWMIAEDSPPVVVNATAIIQTGATLTVSSNTVHFTIPPATSLAEDGTFVPQDSPAITGFLSWKFVPGHRAALRFTSTNCVFWRIWPLILDQSGHLSERSDAGFSL
jgi:hypothetical protein